MKLTLVVGGVSVINMRTIYNYNNLKNEFPREVVKKLLLEDNYTYRELQELYYYNERLWSKLAKEYDIPKQTKNITKNCNNYHKVEIDDNLLIKLYKENKYSLNQLGRVFNCNKTTIKNRLNKLNIEIRPANDKHYYEHRNKSKLTTPYISSDGYITQSAHRQHRLVMEQHLGRKLTSNEHVHHIDFDKTNNDISNLFLFKSSAIHLSYHGYIKYNDYVSPQEFVDNIYPKIALYKSKDFLYEQYVLLNKSVSQIAKEINGVVSRTTLTKLLKKYKLFIEGKHIN